MRKVIADPRAPMLNIENVAARSPGLSTTSNAISGVRPLACCRRDHTKKPCNRKMPHTIMIGAGDISTTLNGAAGPASSSPQRVRLFAPVLIRNTADEAIAAPIQSMLTLDRVLMGLSLSLSL